MDFDRAPPTGPEAGGVTAPSQTLSYTHKSLDEVRTYPLLFEVCATTSDPS